MDDSDFALSPRPTTENQQGEWSHEENFRLVSLTTHLPESIYICGLERRTIKSPDGEREVTAPIKLLSSKTTRILNESLLFSVSICINISLSASFFLDFFIRGSFSRILPALVGYCNLLGQCSIRYVKVQGYSAF